MIIPNLSQATSKKLEKVLPTPMIPQGTQIPPWFGYSVEDQDELDRAWDSGELDHLPKPKSNGDATFSQPGEFEGAEPPHHAQEKSFEEAIGRPMSKYRIFTKAPQPSIFGPEVLFSNVLELRHKHYYGVK